MVKLSWMLRMLMLFFLMADIAFIGVVFVNARLGNLEVVKDLLEFRTTATGILKPSLIGYLGALCISLVYILCLGVLFWCVHKLLSHAQNGSFASDPAARIMRRLGKAMLVLFLILLVAELSVPMMLYAPVLPDIEIDINLFSGEMIMVFVGAAVWQISNLALEAKEMKEELRHVV